VVPVLFLQIVVAVPTSLVVDSGLHIMIDDDIICIILSILSISQSILYIMRNLSLLLLIWRDEKMRRVDCMAKRVTLQVLQKVDFCREIDDFQ
jgi:hypothetical protein